MYVQTILIHGLNAIHSDTNAMNTTLLSRSGVNTSDPWVALLQSALNRFFLPCQSIRNRFRYSAGLTVTATIQDSTHRVTLNSVFAGIIDGGQGSTDRGIP